MANIAIFNFAPSFCPQCGGDIKIKHPNVEADWNARCSFVCTNCRLGYQLVDESKIVAAARDDGGDLEAR